MSTIVFFFPRDDYELFKTEESCPPSQVDGPRAPSPEVDPSEPEMETLGNPAAELGILQILDRLEEAMDSLLGR